MNIRQAVSLYGKNILTVIAGTLILSFGTAVFVIPFNLVTGGVTGISIVVSNMVDSQHIPTNAIIAVLSWFLFVTGLLFLGKEFALKTLISALLYPVGVSLFSQLVTPDILNGVFYLKSSAYGEVAVIPATIVSGVLIGTGCAITFGAGGSSGGVDVIAFIICKYAKKAKHSAVIFTVDAIIILMGMVVIGDPVLSLLGMSSALITAITIDKIFVGESKAFIAHIISTEYEEINRRIITKLNRTTTLSDVCGGYSNKPGKMLMFTFDTNQYGELISLIMECDTDAFVTIHRAHEINGNGW